MTKQLLCKGTWGCWVGGRVYTLYKETEKNALGMRWYLSCPKNLGYVPARWGFTSLKDENLTKHFEVVK